MTKRTRKPLTPEQRERARAANGRWRERQKALGIARLNAKRATKKKELTPEQRARKRESDRRWRSQNRDRYLQQARDYNSRVRTVCQAFLVPPSHRSSLQSNELFVEADRAVPRTYPQHARDDMISEMVLAVLEGNIRLDELRANSTRFASRYWSSRPEYRLRSLDEPTFEGSGRALHDTALVAAIEHVF